jgi:hypothetical protein
VALTFAEPSGPLYAVELPVTKEGFGLLLKDKGRPAASGALPPAPPPPSNKRNSRRTACLQTHRHRSQQRIHSRPG